MLDQHILGPARRISPEAPVPVVEVRQRSFHPGGAANVAANIAGLGGRALLAGLTGADAEGELLRRELARRGVDARFLEPATDRCTTTKTRVIAHHQQIVRFDQEVTRPLAEVAEQRLLARLREALAEAQACVLSDYAKGVLTERVCQGLIRAARSRGIPVIVDPKGADFSKYRGATLLTPNAQEALAVGSLLNGRAFEDTEADSTVEDLGRLLLGRFGVSVVITRGPLGMLLVEPGRRPVHIPARALQVYDVTGAGDTVVAVLALALSLGLELEQAARLANHAAAVAVGKLGTATVSWAEIAQHAGAGELSGGPKALAPARPDAHPGLGEASQPC